MRPPSHTSATTSWTDAGWTWQGLWLTPSSDICRVVVAFHGFGRPLEEMANYLPLYPEGTAMLSVGLSHHNGSTTPLGDKPPVLEPELFQNALHAWVDSLVPESGERLGRALLGYSLGGRIALTLFERKPEAWSGMILLAPDGFRKNPMYRFAVETRLGRATWAWSDRHAESVRSWIRALRRMKVIPAHLEHFALHHTQDQAMRTLVAHTWKTHRAFWPTREGSRQAWAASTARHASVHAVFGTRDAIIPWAWSKPWRSLSSDHVHFLQVESGHVMRHADTVECIAQAILATRDDVS